MEKNAIPVSLMNQENLKLKSYKLDSRTDFRHKLDIGEWNIGLPSATR